MPQITKTATVQLTASKRAKGTIGDNKYEDDGNYGSAATLDVEVLQVISKFVHYGTSTQLSTQITDSAELTASPLPLTIPSKRFQTYDPVPPFMAV